MKIPLFDCHCDALWQLSVKGGRLFENDNHLDLRRFAAYEPRAQFFALWGEGPGAFEKCAGIFRRELAENPGSMALCRSAGDALAAGREGRLAAFLSVEGAELLDCSEEKLERAFEMGVRMVNITWNHANALCGSCAQEPERGLSAAGAAFFDKMQSMGILADMSHISERGFFDCAERAKAPIMASHSNSAAVFPHRRNLTDAQFMEIIRLGGAAGINLYAEFLGKDPGLEDAAAHIERFCALGGEKNVCVGADLDGCEALPRGVRGVEDMGKLYETLLRKNYPEALVRDIFYNNMMRVVKDVLR